MNMYIKWIHRETLQWRGNEHDGVSNHQPYDCLLNRLFRCRSKKTSKLRVTGLCAGNSPVTGEFPAQKASYAENVFIWWRHHVLLSPHRNKAQQNRVCISCSTCKLHAVNNAFFLLSKCWTILRNLHGHFEYTCTGLVFELLIIQLYKEMLLVLAIHYMFIYRLVATSVLWGSDNSCDTETEMLSFWSNLCCHFGNQWRKFPDISVSMHTIKRCAKSMFDPNSFSICNVYMIIVCMHMFSGRIVYITRSCMHAFSGWIIYTTNSWLHACV